MVAGYPAHKRSAEQRTFHDLETGGALEVL
jgi:hypothetical protein